MVDKKAFSPSVDDERVESEIPQDISDNIQYAGFAKRLKAFLFDCLIILAYIAVLLGVGIGITATIGPLEKISPLFASPIFLDAISFVMLILPVILYFALQESSPHQATWGKRKAGIRVVNANGGTLTQKQAFVRSLVKLLPWQIAHTCLYHIPGWPLAVTVVPPVVITGFVLVYLLVMIFIASALISKKKRTPYDWAAGSFVIKAD